MKIEIKNNNTVTKILHRVPYIRSLIIIIIITIVATRKIITLNNGNCVEQTFQRSM